MENNLDNFFKKKLDHREFEMKDAYWAEMEQIIEADEKGNDRKFLWMLLLGAFLLVAVVGGYFWNYGVSSTSISNQIVKTSDDTSSTAKNKETTNLLEKTEAVSLEETNKIESNVSNNEVVSSATVQNDDLNKVLPAIDSKQASNKTISSDAANNILKKSSIKKYSTDSNKNIVAEKKVASEIDDFPTILLPKEKQKEAFTNPKVETPTTTQKSQNQKQQPLPSTDKKVEKAEKPVVKKPIASVMNIPSLDLYPTKKEESLPDLDWSYLKKKRFSMGLTAGIVSFPFEQNTTNSELGAKLGLTARYQLKGNLALNADLMYFYESGKYNPIQSTTETFYSFGRIVNKNDLTPKNIHYLELPIYLTYALKKHIFEGGVSASYLLGVRGATIRTPHEGQSYAIDDSGWIDDSNFKNVFANVALGYRYQISPDLHFGVRAIYTPEKFMNLSDDASISGPERLDIIEQSKLHLNFKLTQYLF